MLRFFCIAAVLLAIVLVVGLPGCSETPSDRLYALWLDHTPDDADWERALPHLVSVRGGRPHRLKSFSAVDDDTVHTTTASCHHGSRLPEPVSVDLRAFYTDKFLYLRLSWEDATCDQSMREWVFDGGRWQNSGQMEDGFGLVWDAKGTFPRFSCSYACHINDFGVNRASFHATNKMRLNSDGQWLDLWNWKASRTAKLGFADDRYLDTDGMHGDLPGEIFRENSRASLGRQIGTQPFTAEDQPIYDSEHRPTEEGAHLPGAKAPGYLVERPVGNRADVTALSRYQNGRWSVVLRRALHTGDPRDVVFVPGDEVGVSFGLALMDHSLYEHYASQTLEKLVLMKPDAGQDKNLNTITNQDDIKKSSSHLIGSLW